MEAYSQNGDIYIRVGIGEEEQKIKEPSFMEFQHFINEFSLNSENIVFSKGEDQEVLKDTVYCYFHEENNFKIRTEVKASFCSKDKDKLITTISILNSTNELGSLSVEKLID
mmetsp:Transcript_20796/g.18421  ORF Transcript_20796/g.18421 Transcript_20796/m.18421 type:complete len:112 (+) Transcript_20796:223-558(+)